MKSTMTRGTAVQEAAATTIQAKIRSITAKKVTEERRKQKQLQQLNLIQLFFVKKDNTSPQQSPKTTKATRGYSRVSLRATITIQRWNRRILARKRSQKRVHIIHHIERIQAPKSCSVDGTPYRRVEEGWKQFLVGVMYIIILRVSIQHSHSPVSIARHTEQPPAASWRSSSLEHIPSFHQAIRIPDDTTPVITTNKDSIPFTDTGTLNMNASVSNMSSLQSEKMRGSAISDVVLSSTLGNSSDDKGSSNHRQEDALVHIVTKAEKTSNKPTIRVAKKRNARISKAVVAQVISASSTGGKGKRTATPKVEEATTKHSHATNETAKPSRLSSDIKALTEALLHKNKPIKLQPREVFLACAEELTDYAGLLYCIRQ